MNVIVHMKSLKRIQHLILAPVGGLWIGTRREYNAKQQINVTHIPSCRSAHSFGRLLENAYEASQSDNNRNRKYQNLISRTW